MIFDEQVYRVRSCNVVDCKLHECRELDEAKDKKALAELEKLKTLSGGALVNTNSREEFARVEIDNASYKRGKKKKPMGKLKKDFLGVLAGLIFITASTSAGSPMMGGMSSITQKYNRTAQETKNIYKFADQVFKQSNTEIKNSSIKGATYGTFKSVGNSFGSAFGMATPDTQFASLLMHAAEAGYSQDDIQQLGYNYSDRMIELLSLPTNNSWDKEYSQEVTRQITQNLKQATRDIQRQLGYSLAQADYERINSQELGIKKPAEKELLKDINNYKEYANFRNSEIVVIITGTKTTQLSNENVNKLIKGGFKIANLGLIKRKGENFIAQKFYNIQDARAIKLKAEKVGFSKAYIVEVGGSSQRISYENHQKIEKFDRVNYKKLKNAKTLDGGRTGDARGAISGKLSLLANNLGSPITRSDAIGAVLKGIETANKNITKYKDYLNAPTKLISASQGFDYSMFE